MQGPTLWLHLLGVGCSIGASPHRLPAPRAFASTHPSLGSRARRSFLFRDLRCARSESQLLPTQPAPHRTMNAVMPSATAAGWEQPVKFAGGTHFSNGRPFSSELTPCPARGHLEGKNIFRKRKALHGTQQRPWISCQVLVHPWARRAFLQNNEWAAPEKGPFDPPLLSGGKP